MGPKILTEVFREGDDQVDFYIRFDDTEQAHQYYKFLTSLGLELYPALERFLYLKMFSFCVHCKTKEQQSLIKLGL
jgi:hypothetical protein